MDKERLLQIAELICDANDFFHDMGKMHQINMEISRTPEILILANWNGDTYLNHYRYRAVSPLICDKLDPDFRSAEKRIRELMEEAGYEHVV